MARTAAVCLGRRTRVALTALAAALGVAAFVGLSKYLLGVELGEALRLLATLPAGAVTAAVVLKILAPPLHSIQLYLVLRSIGLRLRPGRVLVGVYSALALEYLVPLGGVTEVGKIAFLAGEGVAPARATEAVFLHRVLHSALAVAMLAAVAIAVGGLGGLPWVAAAVAAVNAINAVVLLSARSRRLSAILARLPRGLGAASAHLTALDAPRFPYFAVALLATGLERLLSAISGYLVLKHLDPLAGVPHAILLFDLLPTVFWLLPVVTPAGLGQVEAVQVAASPLLGLDRGVVFAAAVLYRVVTVATVVPQLLWGLLAYGADRFAEARACPGGHSKA